jgi:hypothetical protein
MPQVLNGPNAIATYSTRDYLQHVINIYKMFYPTILDGAIV